MRKHTASVCTAQKYLCLGWSHDDDPTLVSISPQASQHIKKKFDYVGCLTCWKLYLKSDYTLSIPFLDQQKEVTLFSLSK